MEETAVTMEGEDPGRKVLGWVRVRTSRSEGTRSTTTRVDLLELELEEGMRLPEDGSDGEDLLRDTRRFRRGTEDLECVVQSRRRGSLQPSLSFLVPFVPSLLGQP